MVDHITEIPLPGRTLASHVDAALDRASSVKLPTFVAGAENNLVASTFGRLLARADSSSEAVLDAVPAGLPRMLNLFGPSGTGKTHLSRGLVRYWQACRGTKNAEYVTALDFRTQFTEVLNSDGLLEFRRHFRTLELLAIDDLQQLPGDDYLLQELRYTFDAIEENGGLLVVTSSRPVATLANLSLDVRSRFVSGLMLQLASPGTAARVRIVRHLSSALGRPLSDEVVGHLAAGLNGTANQLLGALHELWASFPSPHASDTERTERLLAARASRQATLREIVTVVSKHYGVPQKLLKSSSRRQSAVLARATVVYLARELTDASYEQIGSALGGRDHTTIMHNYKKIECDLQRDLALLESMEDLRRILLSR